MGTECMVTGGAKEELEYIPFITADVKSNTQLMEN